MQLARLESAKTSCSQTILIFILEGLGRMIVLREDKLKYKIYLIDDEDYEHA